MNSLFASLLIVSGFLGSLALAAPDGTTALKYLPVQEAGRLKPYDTFARESLQLIYGKTSYEKRPAVDVVTTWFLAPGYWDGRPIVEIPHRGLKDSLKLDVATKYFSPADLFQNPRLGVIMQELQAQREAKAKLSPYFQAVQRLESQLSFYQAIKSGEILRVVPPVEGTTWLSVAQLDGPLKESFGNITRAFVHSLPQTQNDSSVVPPEAEPSTYTGPSLKEAVSQFMDQARAQNPSMYATDTMMRTEVHYNDFHPFRWTWILYLVATLLMGLAWHKQTPLLYKSAWTVMIAAFLLHTYGFALRVYLAGRPPVSNMYESVVWVSWGTLLFAMIFEAIYKRRFILIAGGAIGILSLITADMAPAILDSSIQPLQPVLRSTLWLTVHVLTITISYSAFFLAFGLGDIGLFYVWKGESPDSERLKALTLSIYRCMQVGVVLLAAGTILGGVWADYSWGRFWGWDPKETWALIALLGYLAVLHGRLVGLVKNFGMMACAIVTFSLVLMAWYGVNYVLGAGLHSYGFGAGGVQYVGGFVALHLIAVGYVAFVLRARKA